MNGEEGRVWVDIWSTLLVICEKLAFLTILHASLRLNCSRSICLLLFVSRSKTVPGESPTPQSVSISSDLQPVVQWALMKAEGRGLEGKDSSSNKASWLQTVFH